jgi:phage shock protein C
MTGQASMHERRFYRNADRAMLGGVCAGIADYFGFNLCVTRILAAIAIFTMPVTILGYLALVLLVPSVSSREKQRPVDPEFHRAVRSSPSQTMSDVRSRFRSLDRRLARLEKYVTSSRYQLDREFDRLRD